MKYEQTDSTFVTVAKSLEASCNLTKVIYFIMTINDVLSEQLWTISTIMYNSEEPPSGLSVVYKL